jgi:hypothetical protein
VDNYENGTRQALSNDRPVTMAQASRLAKLGLAIEELAGQTFASVERRLSWSLNPELMGLRKISGRVVRRNLATGVLEPIPYATVHVEDTDCSFLLYSPPHWADWSWPLPFRLRREEIATATTDEKGNFSVHIPRWDIEAVATWRQGRIGFRDFSRPRVRDIVRDLEPQYLSEPPALAIRKPDLVARCRRKVGQTLTDEIEALLVHEGTALTDEALEMLLETPVAPQRPQALDDFLRSELNAKAAARVHGLPLELVKDLGFDRSIGPLWRTSDLVLKLWTLLMNVPDITFRVTRSSGDDSAEELLYSDGFFDVPWSCGPIPQLTLAAPVAAFPVPVRPRRRTEYHEIAEMFPATLPFYAQGIPRFDSTSAF